MSTYKNQNLFSTGPHAFHVHGTSQRHVLHELPGADGARLTTLGKTARTIEQAGTLAADTLDELQQQLDAIEAAMDGTPGALTDDHGRTHENVVLLEFKPDAIRRLGPRYAVKYAAGYVQLNTD